MPGWMTGILIALLALAAAIWISSRTRRWVARSTRTEGTIVELRRNQQGERFWIVRFEDAAGELRDFDINSTSMFDRFHVDRIVPVVYDPDDPSNARLAVTRHLYTLPFLLVLVSLVAILFSLATHPAGSEWLRELLQRPS